MVVLEIGGEREEQDSISSGSETGRVKIGKIKHWGIGKGKEKSEKQSREYWNLITDDNTGRQMEQLLEYWKLVYWNSILEYNTR